MNSKERKELIATAHKWDHVLNFNIADPSFVHGNEEDPLEQSAEEAAWENRTIYAEDAVGILDRAAAYLKFYRGNLYDNAALILLRRRDELRRECEYRRWACANV